MPDFTHEALVDGIIAGVDEAGRGPLAGPVVAAAVIFANRREIPEGIDDSKKLTPAKRELLSEKIKQCCEWSIGIANVEEIDRLNILQASLLAMKRAVDGLLSTPSLLLVDGNQDPKTGHPTKMLIGGDSLSISISAASILAKNARDSLMRELAQTYPQYGWDKNMGYGTRAHLDALNLHGPTPHHRQSFSPVAMTMDLFSKVA